MKKNLSFLLIFSLGVFSFASPVFAQDLFSSVADPRDLVASLIRTIMGFLGTIAVIIILWGGFQWMLAMGDQEKIDKAKKILFSGIIGLIIVMSSSSIATFVIVEIQKAMGM